MLGFDAFHLADVLLTQPLQIIVGDRVGEFGSYRDAYQLASLAAGETDLMVVNGASHYDLYDREPFVDQAVAKLAAFYSRHLATAGGG